MNETNNQITEQPVVQKPSNNDNKKSNVIIILLLVIIIGLVCVLIVELSNKKDNDDKKGNNTETTENINDNTNNQTVNDNTNIKPEENKSTKIDETKGIYYKYEGNSYTIYEKDDEADNTVISYSYPIINSKSDATTKINDEIKKIYEDSEKKLLATNGEGSTCVRLNGTQKCTMTIETVKYEINETETMVNIKIISDNITYRGGADSKIIKSYFVSKTTGEVLSNEEIVKNFNYNSSNLISAYNTYLEHLKIKDKDYFKDLKNITTIDQLILTITNDKKLSIYGPGYGNAEGFYLDYDGIKITNPNEAD